jgi:hypothetical protein
MVGNNKKQIDLKLDVNDSIWYGKSMTVKKSIFFFFFFFFNFICFNFLKIIFQ